MLAGDDRTPGVPSPEQIEKLTQVRENMAKKIAEGSVGVFDPTEEPRLADQEPTP